MSKMIMNALAIAIALTLSGGASAQNMSKDEYKAAQDRIASDYKVNKAKCKTYSGNAKAICMADADGNEKVAKADLEAVYKPSDKARYNAAAAKADADYAVARQKCADMSGNVKDVCVKQAEAARVAAKADAKAQKKTIEARKDAADDKRDADYAVAKEKCGYLAGDAKERCLADAKARFAK